MTTPRLSVVIPTRGRPTLLRRAVGSALRQTLRDIEVIVVVDGPDVATEAALTDLARESADPRLRAVMNANSIGAGAARNAGVAAARGQWIAFLDDDDEWAPTKLEHQLAEIERAAVPTPICFCPIIIRTPTGDRSWRTRPPAADEPISEYLFVRRSLRVGEGTVGTSTILAPRALLEAVPFDPTLRRYQDADWLLRASAAGARLVYCPERLSIWTAPHGEDSITARHEADWRYAMTWIAERRHLVTPRAYAAFVLVRVSALVAAAGERGVVGDLWREARRNGQPGVLDVALFAGRLIVPSGLRSRLRMLLAGVRSGGA